MINGEKWVTLSNVVPVYNALLDHVENHLAGMEEQDDLYDAVVACRDKLTGYYNVSSKLCTAATMLDPRFKTAPYEGNYRLGN